MNALDCILSIAAEHVQENHSNPGRPLRAAKKVVITILIEAIAAVAMSCAPNVALGQEVGLVAGDQVRVRWTVASAYSYTIGTSRFAIAEVVDQSPSGILVRRGGQLINIPRASMRTLERRVGTKPASAPAMVAGSAVGFLVGFAAGAFKAYADPTIGGDAVVDEGIVSGVLLGAPAGALVAYIASRQRGIYERIPLGQATPAVSWTSDGRVGVSMRLPTS